MLGRDVGIPHQAAQVFVAGQLGKLQVTDAGAQHPRGKGVAQVMPAKASDASTTKDGFPRGAQVERLI